MSLTVEYCTRSLGIGKVTWNGGIAFRMRYSLQGKRKIRFVRDSA